MEWETTFGLLAFLALYFILNILGTVYYVKLTKGSASRSVGLVTVLLGWMGLPLVNIYSPVAYSEQDNK